MKSLNDNMLSNTEKTLQPKVVGTLITKKVGHPEKMETTSNSHYNRPSRWPGMSIEFQVKTLLMTKFMRRLRKFMEEMQIVSTKKMLKENIRNAFRNDHYRFRIDYSKLVLSKGNLPIVPRMSVSSPKSGKLVFRWTDDSGIGRSRASDQLFIAIFNCRSKSWILKHNVTKRSAGICTIDIEPFGSKRLQIYIGFVSADGAKVSDSLYMGVVNVVRG
jgi:Family of unknown function (DUF6266)